MKDLLSLIDLPGEFSISAIDTWPLWFTATYCGLIYLGLEILSHIIDILFGFSEKIPRRGKHLDEFDSTDKMYININKLLTMIFVYHVIYVTYTHKGIVWDADKLTWQNSIGSLALFYVFYDFFYMWFHRILHIRRLYPIIHKHHHKQKAPSRGNLDAINVHPFEFVVGEYLHLLTVYVIPCHIYTVAFFIIAGGILASLNHTRHDIRLGTIYEVRWHDIHHRLPENNYGQYTMLWDKVWGSFVPYNESLGSSQKEDLSLTPLVGSDGEVSEIDISSDSINPPKDTLAPIETKIAQCKCGSTTHKRKNNKLCPLNKKI